MTDKPAPAYPVEIFKMWKSARNRRQTLVGAFKQYEGNTFLDCRLFDTNADGQAVPTIKGVTVGLPQLQQFVAGVNKALARAREMGLLEAETTE
jgi:hypothetical protein